MIPTLRTTTDRILARPRILPRVAEIIRQRDVAELSQRLDALNICFSPINRPEDLLTDPHVLRPGGLVNNINADGKPFHVPTLPLEWNGSHIGEGLKVRAARRRHVGGPRRDRQQTTSRQKPLGGAHEPDRDNLPR